MNINNFKLVTELLGEVGYFDAFREAYTDDLVMSGMPLDVCNILTHILSLTDYLYVLEHELSLGCMITTGLTVDSLRAAYGNVPSFEDCIAMCKAIKKSYSTEAGVETSEDLTPEEEFLADEAEKWLDDSEEETGTTWESPWDDEEDTEEADTDWDNADDDWVDEETTENADSNWGNEETTEEADSDWDDVSTDTSWLDDLDESEDSESEDENYILKIPAGEVNLLNIVNDPVEDDMYYGR